MKQNIIGYMILIGIIIFLVWLVVEYFTPSVFLAFFAGATPSGILLYLEKKKEEKEHHNWLLRNKEACLVEIVDIFISTAHETDVGRDAARNKKLLKKIKHLKPALFVWGTPPILHAWNEMQQMSITAGNEKNIVRAGERFFRTIRKELGHDDSSLKPGELWASILKPEDKQMALDACKGEVYE